MILQGKEEVGALELTDTLTWVHVSRGIAHCGCEITWFPLRIDKTPPCSEN